MGALFVRPLPFVAATTSPAPLIGSVANMNIDLPGMVWRFGLTTPYFIIDLGANAVAYDTVALAGCNLRAGDTVQIRTGTTNTGTGNYAGTALPAWTGSKADTSTADAIFRLGAVRTERYVRVDIVATSHPDGFVQVQRAIVGKSISTLGIDFNAEQKFDDQSVVTVGPGYVSVDEYDVLISWKFSTGWISEVSYRTEWFPMLQNVGNRRGLLFIPDDSTPSNWQTDAVYGRIVGAVTGKAESFNGWRFEGTISAFSS
jgi:hypothetical protein